MLDKLKMVRDEIFGPNSSLYECTTDQELQTLYDDFNTTDWWKTTYKTKEPLKAWVRFQLEMEKLFWEREGIDSGDFIRDIQKRIKRERL